MVPKWLKFLASFLELEITAISQPISQTRRERWASFMYLPPVTPSLSFLISLCCFKKYLGEKFYLLLSNGKNKPNNSTFHSPYCQRIKHLFGFSSESFFYVFFGAATKSCWEKELLTAHSYCCNECHFSRKFYSAW